jgi:hypothetical protein
MMNFVKEFAIAFAGATWAAIAVVALIYIFGAHIG